jgi:citronellol/citronellal dehydrogenase
MVAELGTPRILMSGGSRGIGLAIAVAAAKRGAKIALLAKTDAPNPRLSGTIHTAAARIEEAGGEALPIVGDVRDDAVVSAAVESMVERFGGVDIVIHNASAIDLRTTEEISLKRYDLMQDVNVRGTFLLTKLALPHLRQGINPHILTLSPPLNLDLGWVGAHAAYTMSKYGMSLCTLGLAEELHDAGIAANSLWPRTMIATDAVRNLLGGEEAVARSRTVEIVADAAIAILARPAHSCTGNLFIDEEVLREEGVTNFAQYATGPSLALDLFVGSPLGSRQVRASGP